MGFALIKELFPRIFPGESIVFFKDKKRMVHSFRTILMLLIVKQLKDSQASHFSLLQNEDVFL